MDFTWRIYLSCLLKVSALRNIKAISSLKAINVRYVGIFNFIVNKSIGFGTILRYSLAISGYCSITYEIHSNTVMNFILQDTYINIDIFYLPEMQRDDFHQEKKYISKHSLFSLIMVWCLLQVVLKQK